jgi:hypothetical protein
MSVIDKVVTEWAFRCKKGYPDMNNPADMKILKEIYSEYGIVLEAETPKETPPAFTKDSLKALIDSADLTADQIAKIHREVVKVGYHDTVMGILGAKGFTADRFKSGNSAVELIFNRIADTDVEKLSEYLEDPKELQPGTHNFATLTELPPQMIIDLLTIEPGSDNAGSNIGRGEIALGILFKDVDNSDTSGDLKWKGTNLEVKGTGGRLGQQGGRSGNVSALELMSHKLLSDVDAEALLDLPNVGVMSYGLMALYDVANKAGKTDPQIFKVIQDGLDSIYYGQGVAKDYFNGKADLSDTATVKRNLLKLNVESYMKKNNVGSLLFFNNNLDYLAFSKEQADSLITSGKLDTSTAAKPDPSKGFSFNNPYPQIYFKK